MGLLDDSSEHFRSGSTDKVPGTVVDPNDASEIGLPHGSLALIVGEFIARNKEWVPTFVRADQTGRLHVSVGYEPPRRGVLMSRLMKASDDRTKTIKNREMGYKEISMARIRESDRGINYAMDPPTSTSNQPSWYVFSDGTVRGPKYPNSKVMPFNQAVDRLTQHLVKNGSSTFDTSPPYPYPYGGQRLLTIREQAEAELTDLRLEIEVTRHRVDVMTHDLEEEKRRLGVYESSNRLSHITNQRSYALKDLNELESQLTQIARLLADVPTSH